MSDSFSTILIKDSSIADITDKYTFGVESGASSKTYTRFPSTSASTSSLVFSVQVPSDNVVIDREVLLQTTINFTITIPGTNNGNQIANGTQVFNVGQTDAFQAFPLNSLFTTSQCQFNNANVSCNTQDIIQQILRMNSSRELYRYNSTTCALPDQQIGEYLDYNFSACSPLNGQTSNGYDLDFMPRGAWGNATYTITHQTGAAAPNPAQDASPRATAANGQSWSIAVSATFCEPLLGLSPFTWTDDEYNKQGLLGIQNMAFTFNIDSTCKRLWSTSSGTVDAGVLYPYITNITLNSIQNANLLFCFKSLQSTDLVPTRNVCPYYTLPRFITPVANTQIFPAWNQTTLPIPSQTIQTSSLQLNSIPDLIICVIRQPLSTYPNNWGWAYSSSFMAINTVSINFNNASGLLSSATAYDLWKMSVKNGSQQTWNEFCGFSKSVSLLVGAPNTSSGVGVNIPTTGSLLVINPAMDLSLPVEFSAGSQGNYNLQMIFSASNQFQYQIQPEIVIMTMLSGVVVTQQGVSQLYTSLLTKDLVLKTKEDKSTPQIDSVQYQRLVGGKLGNRASSAVHKMLKHATRKMEAGAMSAGELSGGADSGGAMRKNRKLSSLLK